jgi:hypothetical protein
MEDPYTLFAAYNLYGHTKIFLRNYPQLGHAPTKGFAKIVLEQKSLKGIGLKKRQIFPARGGHISRADTASRPNQ